MNLNRENLEIKYYLNVYPSLPDYPTNQDLLFELVTSIDEDTFDYKTMKYSVSAKLTKERFEEFILYCKENKFVNDSISKGSFKLIKHLWE